MRAAKLGLLLAARTLGLFRLARRVTRYRIRIVCYHGGTLGDEHRFNPLLFCAAEHLDSRLRWLGATGFSFVSLSSAIKMVRSEGARPPLPTVITFDDGWYSTYASLAPVVARHRTPAVLYLCTGYFASGQPVPDVTLNYLLWKAGRRPVTIAGLDESLDGTHDLSRDDQRRQLWQRALPWIQGEPGQAGSITGRLQALAAQLGVDAGGFDLASRRFGFVNAEEIHRMRADGWEIELHGHRHLYPAGRPEELAEDLHACRAERARIGLEGGAHYCYPSGNHDSEAARLLGALGVVSATTCLPGLVPEGGGSDLYYLPRLLDGERIHPLEFESEMSGFSDGIRAVARALRPRHAVAA